MNTRMSYRVGSWIENVRANYNSCHARAYKVSLIPTQGVPDAVSAETHFFHYY